MSVMTAQPVEADVISMKSARSQRSAFKPVQRQRSDVALSSDYNKQLGGGVTKVTHLAKVDQPQQNYQNSGNNDNLALVGEVVEIVAGPLASNNSNNCLSPGEKQDI